MVLRDRVESIARAIVESFEEHWFDLTRHVRTRGNLSLRSAGVASEDVRDSELYVPARPANIRQALRATGVHDASEYSYIDLGSGKGRSLFVAAEWPFRQIIGVEFSERLHQQACENIARFLLRRKRLGRISSVFMNVKDFTFPEGKLVVYLFNPFGAETMQHVLQHLELSLKRQPRHVVVVLLWPLCGDQVAAIKGMQLLEATRRHEIFAAHAPAL